MHQIYKLILYVFVFLGSGIAYAQIEDFLIPVKGHELVDAVANNDYFLKRNLYWAKQHKIVKVNTNLLTDAEGFRISLTDEIALTVAVKELDIRHEGRTIIWRGEIIDPNFSQEEFLKNGYEAEDIDLLRSRFVDIAIYASEISFDDTKRRKYQHRNSSFDGFKDSETAESELYDISSKIDLMPNIDDPASITRYILRPFKRDPRLHLLVEIDPSKMFPGGDPEDADSPELAQKRRDHLLFLESLGPDPNLEVDPEDRRQ